MMGLLVVLAGIAIVAVAAWPAHVLREAAPGKPHKRPLHLGTYLVLLYLTAALVVAGTLTAGWGVWLIATQDIVVVYDGEPIYLLNPSR